MDVELSQSHKALPASAALEVAVLLKVTPGGVGGATTTSVHAGWCLDVSGSMGDRSGVSTLTKLDALKAATQAALGVLERHGAMVTVSAFSDREQALCRREPLGAGGSRAVCGAVEALQCGGGTEARLALAPVLDALKPADHAARRLILVTDGQFNNTSTKPARALARAAGEAGIAVWAFATGVTYDEPYLRELVGLGAAGGLFHHIQSLSALGHVLEEEFNALAGSAGQALDVTLRPGNGVTLLEVLRLVPTQVVVAPGADGTLREHLDVVDARGQAWVVRVRLDGKGAGKHPLFHGTLRWREGGQPRSQTLEPVLEVLPPGAAVGAPNAAVASTVLMAHAAQATVMGNAALATHLYAAAGQTDLAQKLQALGTALPQGSDVARALRTQALGSTRLVALGSANVGNPVKGGTP